MSSADVLGKFLWHELLTSDPEAGAGFYSQLLGWSVKPWEGDSSYMMLTNAHGVVGGARVAGQDPLVGVVGPSWLSYVGVPDIQAALKAVEAHGGKVLHPVTAVSPEGGRYAVIADPHGGIIGVFQPPAAMPGAPTEPTHMPIMWHELTSPNVTEALEFYKAIFGWDLLATHPMGGEVGDYYLFGVGDTQRGGAYARPKTLPPTWPHWLVYLSVPSVTAAVKALEAAGGQLLSGPNEVPGGSWIAQATDAHGIPLALIGPKDAAVSKPKPKAKAKAKPAEKPKAEVKSKPEVVVPAPKAKAKPAVVKTKTKSKTKAATKTKTKMKKKAKVSAPVKAKTKPKTKLKTKAKTKTKAKKKSSVKSVVARAKRESSKAVSKLQRAVKTAVRTAVKKTKAEAKKTFARVKRKVPRKAK